MYRFTCPALHITAIFRRIDGVQKFSYERKPFMRSIQNTGPFKRSEQFGSVAGSNGWLFDEDIPNETPAGALACFFTHLMVF